MIYGEVEMALKDLYEQIEQESLNRKMNNIPANEIRDIVNQLVDENGTILFSAVTKLLNIISQQRGYNRDIKMSHVKSAIRSDKSLIIVTIDGRKWIERA